MADGPVSPFYGGSGKSQTEIKKELGLAGVASMISCRPESATPLGASVNPGESPEVRALNIEKRNLIQAFNAAKSPRAPGLQPGNQELLPWGPGAQAFGQAQTQAQADAQAYALCSSSLSNGSESVRQDGKQNIH